MLSGVEVGRVREGVESSEIAPVLSLTPHPGPLPTRKRELNNK